MFLSCFIRPACFSTWLASAFPRPFHRLKISPTRFTYFWFRGWVSFDFDPFFWHTSFTFIYDKHGCKTPGNKNPGVFVLLHFRYNYFIFIYTNLNHSWLSTEYLKCIICFTSPALWLLFTTHYDFYFVSNWNFFHFVI